MSLRFITGRCGSGKSSRVLSEIYDALNEGHTKLFLMVPEQYTLQAERDLIYELNLPGVINIEVLSFSRLAHKVFNEAGGLAKVHINEHGRHMVLRRLLDKNRDKLTIYKTVSKQNGFIKKTDDLITEFKKQDITPEMLRESAQKLDGSSGLLKMKLNDLAVIYELYNDYLSNHYIDSEDAINSLISKLDKAEFLKDSFIWMDEFDYLPPLHIRILEKLMLLSRQLTITFTVDEKKHSNDSDIFKIHEMSMLKVQKIAKSNNVDIEYIEMSELQKPDLFKAPEILHLEKELYSYPYKPYSGKVENVEIFAGNSMRSEVENTSSKIIALSREKGWRYSNMAVISGDIERYGGIIKRVFNEYGIPFFFDQKRPVINNPIINLVLACVKTIEKGYRYEDVFKLLKTGFCGLSIDEVELLENYCLEYGITGRKWFEEFVYGAGDYDIDALNDLRERFAGKISRLDKALKSNKDVASKVRALYDYLVSISLQEQIEKWILTLREKGLFEYADENAQIWNILMDSFDQLVEILGDQNIGIKDFSGILEAGFSNVEVGVIPTTLDQVLVGNVQRSKSQDIKALFVVGCNDGILPSSNYEEGLLADDERDALGEIGIELGMNSGFRAANEKFTIYTAFSKPTDYLRISYSLSNADGGATRPSNLIFRLKKLFNGIKTGSDLLQDEEAQKQLVSVPGSTFKFLTENMRLYADGVGPDTDLWFHVYNWYFNQPEWKQRLSNMAEGLFYSNQVKSIGASRAAELYGNNIRASVSRLEQYVNCPFAHFVHYGLKPRERKMYTVAAPDLGELFHRFIEGFTKKLAERQIDWRTMEDEQISGIIDEVMDEVVPSHNYGILLSTKRYEYLARSLKRVSKRAIWLLTDHIKRSNFNPLGYEISFGFKGTFPPIRVDLADGRTVYLEGRIDRADMYSDGDNHYIEVIDYKSGYEDFSLSDAYYGLKLQLLVYLHALIENFQAASSGNVCPAGIFYFKIDDPLIDTQERIDDVIIKEMRKKLKLKGLLLKDVNIAKTMDSALEDGWSEILPFGITKNGSFYNKSRVASIDEFNAILGHVKNLIADISNEMLNGNIRIDPVKNEKRTACMYCLYRGICGFDTKIEDNRYKVVKRLNDQDVMNRISQTGQTGGQGPI